MAEVDLMVEENIKDKTVALHLTTGMIEMVGEEVFPLWVSPIQGETMKLKQ